MLGEFGWTNHDLIINFSAANDTIVLANSLDSDLISSCLCPVNPGITGLLFNGGDVPGNILNADWFFKGAGLTGALGSNLSGIYLNTTNGDIFYNPDSTTAGSLIIANVGTAAAGWMTNADFVYGV